MPMPKAARWPMVTTILCCLAPIIDTVSANTVRGMTLKPAQCVAYKQGQTCYVDITVRWQATEKGFYCLYSSERQKPLKCWHNEGAGEYSQEVATARNIDYFLKRMHDTATVLEASLEVAWVYQKSSRPMSSWRMF